MEIFPVWKDLFFEYQGDVLEYRITIKDGDEIFHGRAVKSPKDRVIRIRLNDCCESYLNSLLGEEAFREAENIDRAFPLDAYREFALDTLGGGVWETAFEWAFTNDYSYDYKEPQGSYSEPINGHAAAGQLLPYSHLVTGDTESVCYDGCGGVFFNITTGAVRELRFNGGSWTVRWDTNLDSVYYECSDGTTGTISNNRFYRLLPRNESHFSKQYTVRFYDRQGGTLLGTAVATVDALPDSEPEPIAKTLTIISYPSVITNETTAVTVEYSINDREDVLFELYSSTTQGSGYQYYDGYRDSRPAGVNSETLTIPANTDTNPVYYRISLYIMGLDPQYADITQLGTPAASNDYLTMEILSPGTIHWGGTYPTGNSWEYSLDDCTTWNTLEYNGTDLQVTTGDVVKFRGEVNKDKWASFSGSTAYFNLSGNIMSLAYGDNFEGQTSLENLSDTGGGLACLFYHTNVVSARDLSLPATALSLGCYERMFYGCTSLVSAPYVLPATSRPYYGYMFAGCTALVDPPILPSTSQGAYAHMFQGCTSLTTAPELPLQWTNTGSVIDAYSYMFAGCTSLVTPPPYIGEGIICSYMFSGCTSLTYAPVLQSPRLANNIYEGMFAGCTSLVTAPALPVTTLVGQCYIRMFRGCTSLTTAPELPAATLQSQCYNGMFSGCTSLNYVKCLATSGILPGMLNNWLSGVPASGTFTKAAGTTWSRGASGIPTGWIVVEE